MKVFVTGSNGFVGSYLSKYLEDRGISVLKGTRGETSCENGLSYGDLSSWKPESEWMNKLDGVDAVVHCAARVHVMEDTSEDPLEEFRVSNVTATTTLAQRAAKSGVKKFIYLSSIKVNGEYTLEGKPFTASDIPAPQDPYGVSKWEAEQRLKELSQNREMEFVILRPPLIYGPGVKGNLKRLLDLIGKTSFMPLGGINNKRSLVSLKNLSAVIYKSLNTSLGDYRTFVVSDGNDVSTSDLIRYLGKSISKDVILVPMPYRLLSFFLKLIGKANLSQRIFGNLQVEISTLQDELKWQPESNLEALFKEMSPN